jgi:hypothetical protein
MEFNFSGLASALAVISFGMAGLILTGSLLFPETAQRYKRQIPDILIGLVLVAAASYIVTQFGR